MLDYFFLNPVPADFSKARAYISRLDSLSVLDIVGIDCFDYLHNLLTNDIKHLDDDNARLGGLCSIQGKLLVTFIYWRLNGGNIPGIRLLLSTDLYEKTLKIFSSYVFRSKVQIINRLESYSIYGIFGDKNSLSLSLAPYIQNLPSIQLARIDQQGKTLIQLSSIRFEKGYQQDRYIWIVKNGCLDSHLIKGFTPSSLHSWEWLEVRSGEPRIVAATSNLFLPQMVNYEILGGINFRKGCFPGQEVIARTQYRGTVKRRAALAHTDSRLCIGDEIFSTHQQMVEPMGITLLSAPNPYGGTDAIIVLKTIAYTKDLMLSLIDSSNLPVNLLSLPYLSP